MYSITVRVVCGLCALLLLCFCFIRPASAAAATATVAVTGGSIAGAGLIGEGLASAIFPPVAVILGLTLAGAGINTVVSDAARAEGMTKTQYISSKWSEFSEGIGQSQQSTSEAIIRNTEIAADGTIALAGGAAELVRQFGDWLYSNNDVQSAASGVGDADYHTVVLDGQTFPVGNVSTVLHWDATQENPRSTPRDYIVNLSGSDNVGYFVARVGTIYYIYAVSVSPEHAEMTGDWNISIDTTLDKNSGYYYNLFGVAFRCSVYSFDGVLPVFDVSCKDVLSSLPANPNWDVGGTADAEDVLFLGDRQAWTDNQDVLNPALDERVLVNPDYLNGLLQELQGNYTIGAQDYLDALRRAWEAAGTAEGAASIPLTDVKTGLTTEKEVSKELTANPSITKGATGDQTLTPALDVDALGEPSQIAEGLQVNITEIFPFCIPFDIARVATLLEAEPVAPVLRWRFYIPEIVDYTLEVDLSPWEPVAVILRGGEVLLFIVGLAFITRPLIRG